MNTKADALTRMPITDGSESAQRTEDRYQTILTSDRVDVLEYEVIWGHIDILVVAIRRLSRRWKVKSLLAGPSPTSPMRRGYQLPYFQQDVLATESETDLYQRVQDVNKTDELCNEYRQAIVENKLKLHSTKLKHCEVVDGVLFRKGLLWVPEDMHTELLQEIHDRPSTSHRGNRRTIDLVQRFYYWPGHRATIRQYIRNCQPRDSTNGLHHPLPIPQERWKDIAMDFITGLPLSEGYNAICTIICRLTKERHYVPCHWGDGGTSAE